MSRYGEEFKTSYFILKLLDKNQTLKYTRELAKISKGLDVDTKDVESIIKQSEEVLKFMYEKVAECFVAGEVYDEDTDALRPANKEDLDLLPPKVIKDVTSFVQGNLEKKS